MAAYECWRTEPIDVDGKPVSLRGIFDYNCFYVILHVKILI